MAIRDTELALSISAGVRHSVAVYAGSVLEAAATGLKQIRETEMIGDDGVEDLTVDIKTTTFAQGSVVQAQGVARKQRPRST